MDTFGLKTTNPAATGIGEYAMEGGAYSGEIRSGRGYVVLWEPWVISGAFTFPGQSRPFRKWSLGYDP